MADLRVLDRPIDTALPVTPAKPRKARIVLLQTQAEAAGAQEVSRILGRGLSAQGYDVHHVFCYRRTAAFDDQPNTHFCAMERPRGVMALVRLFGGLVAYLKGLRPDAIVCFQHYGNVIGTVAARRAGIRTVIVNRNSSHELIPAWVKGIDLAFGVAGWFQRTVVNSGSVEREYHRYPQRYRKGIVRIEHGFETRTTTLDRREARRRFGLPEDAVLLGSAARLHRTKNLEAAIRLLPDRNWHLALAGQGPVREELAALARSLGVLDRLHLIGELSADRMGDFLGSLDVFVFPSKAETFGLAAVEAAQSGVPVVANDLPVLREVLSVSEKPCALFVDADDQAAFAAAVEQFLTDQALRQTITARAAKLSRRYSLDAMVGHYAALIDKTIAGNRRP